MASEELKNPVECSSFARKVKSAMMSQQLMKNKSDLENKISFCHFPRVEAWGLLPGGQVFTFNTVCLLWLRAPTGWWDGIPLSCRRASLFGSWIFWESSQIERRPNLLGQEEFHSSQKEVSLSGTAPSPRPKIRRVCRERRAGAM